ncbi:MAG: hypothetical protein CMF50_10145 [Legionellales bacterium]|nr:hypothetical protein [Legionellales bacterium]|tara:strand:+ start:23829 stop:25079 length:1251 start_codon:yes stop_codon:yes gene_type:complete
MTHNRLSALAPLFLIIIIDAMGAGLIFPILAPLFADKTAGLLPADASEFLQNTLYGIAIGIFFLFSFFAAPLLGDLSDRLGRKRVLFICLLGTAISFFLCALGITAQSLSLLLLGRALSGIAAGSQGISQAAIVDISTPESKAANLGYIVLAACVGFVVGPLIGGFFSHPGMVSWFSYSTPFYVAALLSLFNSLLLLALFKETYDLPEQHDLSIMKIFHTIKYGFTLKSLRMLLLVFLFMQLAWGIYFQFVSLYLAQVFHYDGAQAGYFLTFLAAIFIFSLTIGIKLFYRFFKTETVAIIGFSLMVAGSILAVIFQSELSEWLVLIPIGTGVGITYTTLLALMSNHADDHIQGMVMGLSQSLIAIDWFIGGVLIGPLTKMNIHFPFVIVAVGFVIALLLMCRIIRVDKQNATTPSV